MQTQPTKADLPDWVQAPEKYFELLSYDQEKFLPWYLFDKENLLFRLNGLHARYPNRELCPFARHDYSDDVACWEKEKPGKVIIIHDYASPGYETRHEFNTFEDWYIFILSEIEN